jgi:hypothetical protein
MRGLEVDNQPCPYNITSSGLEVIKFMRLFLSRSASEGNPPKTLTILSCEEEIWTFLIW